MEAGSSTAQKSGVSWSGIIGVIAAGVSVFAGIYLLGTESASEDSTVFDALFDGLGFYMIARGLWMFSRLAGGRRP